jgi:hypothetical protein
MLQREHKVMTKDGRSNGCGCIHEIYIWRE